MGDNRYKSQMAEPAHVTTLKDAVIQCLFSSKKKWRKTELKKWLRDAHISGYGQSEGKKGLSKD